MTSIPSDPEMPDPGPGHDPETPPAPGPGKVPGDLPPDTPSRTPGEQPGLPGNDDDLPELPERNPYREPEPPRPPIDDPGRVDSPEVPIETPDDHPNTSPGQTSEGSV
ncbi:hypothetical protein [Notoacmeibacter ruber]|uniref:Uncharacterized protein n=1 Tax=Notoacmeibacter ruber TaxID=2670375 RepID=A0A3L7JD58_9HYPH|nr:hypothetical protein [Notoacmeibacter ruber]RLQ88410.1 hypothetical protein D8780_09535 [Notoacmeibacter ruber]